MKRLLILLICFCTVLSAAAQNRLIKDYLIPIPKELTRLREKNNLSEEQLRHCEHFLQSLHQHNLMKPQESKQLQYLKMHVDPSLKPQEYGLRINIDKIEIVGGDLAAVFYGTRTLLQLIDYALTEKAVALLEALKPEKNSIVDQFTYAGIPREYMLHLPKDADGNVIPNVPLMVWQIGGGEYDRDLMTCATANRCLVSLATEGVPCAALMFAIANPNYSYSASLYPEKIELIDRNNALQMAFIDTLIAEGKVDGSRLFCAGASSGGGCTLRFMMQFPDRFKAAIPCCPMDPIVPIHQVKEKYEGQFVADLVKAFQGKVYKWNGSDMVLSPIDTKAFVELPMYFVHASSDQTCKITSSYSYIEARKRLGAREDKLRVYSDEDMAAYGLPPMIAHFSWVPLLDDYSEGSVMRWMTGQF